MKIQFSKFCQRFFIMLRLSVVFVLINLVKSGQEWLNWCRAAAEENLQDRNQEISFRLLLLSEGWQETEAGAEDEDETAGEAGVPHVGDLVDAEVKPPGVGRSLQGLHWRRGHIPVQRTLGNLHW